MDSLSTLLDKVFFLIELGWRLAGLLTGFLLTRRLELSASLVTEARVSGFKRRRCPGKIV
jgi:hypothetical protein